MNAKELMMIAKDAAKNAYAPYSRFRVGAALEMSDGKIITGSNIENRSFGLSICAERSAIFTALSQNRKDILQIAIAGPDSREALPPCGGCRQVISEFCEAEIPIFYDDGNGGFVTSSVGELYPHDSLHDFQQHNRLT